MAGKCFAAMLVAHLLRIVRTCRVGMATAAWAALGKLYEAWVAGGDYLQEWLEAA